ncbi:MAG: isocitrate lyase/phosphoenolpyruvate mutase family protein [Pseudomonadota bacterium]
MHKSARTFVMPNAWDAGSARILEGLGFPALATTSAGLAYALGVKDSRKALSRQQVMENAKSIVEATSLPVSGDLENGFGDAPEAVAETIRQAIDIGLSGGAIEDATGEAAHPIYPFEHAVARIRAAVDARGSRPFLITARAENYVCGRPDLDDTIKRLLAFEAAGADVLYAPGLADLATVKAIREAVKRPLNVVVGLVDADYTIADLSALGVTRISTGGSLARAALGEMKRAATELRTLGTFTYASRAMSDADASAEMRATTPR